MSIDGKHAYRFGYLKSETWQCVRLETLVREHGKCQICGEESIHNDAHHIWYPKNIYDTAPDHLIILCRDCHEFLHTMTPECKTKDEKVGRETWNKLRRAIVHWRQMKDGIFKDLSPVAAKGGASNLRFAYDALKQSCREKERVISQYREKFGVLKDAKYSEAKSVKKMNLEQQVTFVRDKLKLWSLAYRDKYGSENNVDSSDYLI